MTDKLVFDTLVDIERDDGGASVQLEMVGEPKDTFVRFLSWDEEHNHVEMQPFMGKRVRVTVEVIEDEPDTSTIDPDSMTRGQLAIEEDRLTLALGNYVTIGGIPFHRPTGEIQGEAELARHKNDRKEIQSRLDDIRAAARKLAVSDG